MHWSREVIKDGRVDAVILNSGGANACTGPQGFQTPTPPRKRRRGPWRFRDGHFRLLHRLIGEQLPMDKLVPAISVAAGELSADGGRQLPPRS